MRYESLKLVREDWEEDSIRSWEFIVNNAVIVIVEWNYNELESFTVHRYFKVGANWACSVDLPGSSLREAIATTAQLISGAMS